MFLFSMPQKPGSHSLRFHCYLLSYRHVSNFFSVNLSMYHLVSVLYLDSGYHPRTIMHLNLDKEGQLFA